VCAPARLLEPGYRPHTSEDDEALLECGPEDAAAGRLLCLAIVTFPEAGPPTANLLAPVLLNELTGRGVQSIQCSGEYSHCHPLRGEAPCS
jgi:flagellar assembly factor FliW